MSRSLSSWFTSWIAALRIARREAVRHKARNLLIVAMLMLPVLGVCILETVIASTDDLSAREQLTRISGSADAWITRTSTKPVQQSTGVPTSALPADWAQEVSSGVYGSMQPSAAQQADAGGIRAALPGATLLPETTVWGLFMSGPAGYATPQYTKVDLTKPQLAGAFDLLSGHVPQTASQLDLTPRTMQEFGAQIGSTITLPASSSHDGEAATFTVVGTMYQPDQTNADEVFGLPSAPVASGENPVGWFVINPGGVGWSQVQAMNKSGYVVTSHEVTLDPPSASQVPYTGLRAIQQPSVNRLSASDAAVLGISVAIALLEVVLLAGPAFAVSARRREREYAIIGAVGAEGAHLRRIVLADGLVLGAVAGVVGSGLGFGVAAAVLPFFHHLGSLPGHVHVDLRLVAGVAVLSIVPGLCAAWMPARSVARRDILTTLRGRRAVPTRRVRAGRLIGGIALLALGAAAVLLDRVMSPSFSAVYVVSGIALMEVGCIMITPAVIGAAARLGRVLPLGPRLALRDSARHTGRTTPAVAAMFVAVAGAVAAGGWFDASLAQGRATYQPALLANQVGVANVTGQAQATQVVAKLGAIMPITHSMMVTELNALGGDDNDEWQVAALPPSDPGACVAGSVTTAGSLSATPIQGCGDGLYGTSMAYDLVGGPDVLKELTGLENAQTDAALNDGGAVVFEPDIVQNGKAIFVVQHEFADKKKPGTTTQTNTLITAPAVYVNPQGMPNPGVVMSSSLARQLGAASGGTTSLLVDLKSHITATQQFAAGQALTKLGVASGLTVESGYVSQLTVANLAVLAVALLLAIGAAAIATGLALVDGRADHDTLTAVGGSPWTRRWLAGSTALVITGLGILIGVPLGFVIAEGLLRVANLSGVGPQPSIPKPFVVPWLNLGVLVIVVPALTALGTMALTRSKLRGVWRTEY